MTRLHGIAALLLCAIFIASATEPGSRQEAAPPHTVVRRLAQALYPLVLFDSTGKPEAGQAPVYKLSEFFQVHESESSPELPGVEVWEGTAFRCYDCSFDRAAVVRLHGTEYSIIGIGDLAPVLEAVLPPRMADSATVRVKVVALLGTTCIIECRVLPSPIQGRYQGPDHAGACRASSSFGAWAVEPASETSDENYRYYRFTVQTSYSINRISVTWSDRGYELHAKLVADCTIQA